MFSWFGQIFSKSVGVLTASAVSVFGLFSPAEEPPQLPVEDVNQIEISEELKIEQVAVKEEIEEIVKPEIKKEEKYIQPVIQKEEPIQPVIQKEEPKPVEIVKKEVEKKTYLMPSGAIVDETGNIINKEELKRIQEEKENARKLDEQNRLIKEQNELMRQQNERLEEERRRQEEEKLRNKPSPPIIERVSTSCRYIDDWDEDGRRISKLKLSINWIDVNRPERDKYIISRLYVKNSSPWNSGSKYVPMESKNPIHIKSSYNNINSSQNRFSFSFSNVDLMGEDSIKQEYYMTIEVNGVMSDKSDTYIFNMSRCPHK